MRIIRGEKNWNNHGKTGHHTYFNLSFRLGLRQIMSFSLNHPQLAWTAARLYFSFRLAEYKRAGFKHQGSADPAHDHFQHHQ